MSDPVNWTDEVLRIGRVTHLHELVDPELFDYDVDDVDKPPVVTVEDGANVVSSLLTNGNHAPCIDLDVPAMLVPSSTPGHSHLYIDIEVPWKNTCGFCRSWLILA